MLDYVRVINFRIIIVIMNIQASVCWQKPSSQSRHEELRVKARLLLEKAQRESIDIKSIQPCDEANPSPQHQQQFQSADNTVTAVAESSATAGEFCFCCNFI